jgi:hypothetical protein
MADNDRQGGANQADDQAISDETDEQRAARLRAEEAAESSAPAPGDDIIIK